MTVLQHWHYKVEVGGTSARDAVFSLTIGCQLQGRHCLGADAEITTCIIAGQSGTFPLADTGNEQVINNTPY